MGFERPDLSMVLMFSETGIACLEDCVVSEVALARLLKVWKSYIELSSISNWLRLLVGIAFQVHLYQTLRSG